MMKKILCYSCIFWSTQGISFCNSLDIWNGFMYHNNSTPQYAIALETLKEVSFNQIDKILDIGCGSGDISANLIAPLVPQGHVLGIDMSGNMIEFARQAYKNIPNVNFDIVDVRDWIPAHKEYDCAVSFNVFHWIKDLRPVFVNVAQCLKPEGIFLFAMGYKNNFFTDSTAAVASSSKWAKYLKNPIRHANLTHDKESIKEILEYAGFKPLVIKKFNQKINLASEEKFALFTRAWIYAIPELKEIPEDLCEDYINDIIKNSPINYNEDGSIYFFTSILIVKAVKLA